MPVATPRRILAVLVERRRQEQLLAGRHVLAADDLLLLHADEVVDVVEPVVLDVERVTAEERAVGEQYALRRPPPGCRPSAPIVNERLRTFTACDSGTSAVPGK